MKNFGDIIMGMPKWVLGIIVGVLFLLIGGSMFYSVFKDKIKVEQKVEGNVVQVFPDGESMSIGDKINEMRSKNDIQEQTNNKYWNALGENQTNGSETGASSSSQGNVIYQDSSRPAIPSAEELKATGKYDAMEILEITNGLATAEQIDARHAKEAAAKAAEQKENAEFERRYQQETSDSAYVARMEKAMAVAAKYTDRGVAAEEVNKKPEEKKPAEPRRIEISANSGAIKTHSIVGDDIITSLGGDNIIGGVNDRGNEQIIAPVKTTFLKNETVYSGSRVIMRLMQDLQLSDGSIIPANTHISGICKLGERMNIHVSTISYGGKIYYADLDIYDNDGTEGIYCPAVVVSNQKKNARNVGRQIGQTASQVLGTIASAANPYIGRMTQAGADGIIASVDAEGNISVAVVPGYEFFVYENLKKEK